MLVLAHAADYAFFAPVIVVLTCIIGNSYLQQRRDERARRDADG